MFLCTVEIRLMYNMAYNEYLLVIPIYISYKSKISLFFLFNKNSLSKLKPTIVSFFYAASTIKIEKKTC